MLMIVSSLHPDSALFSHLHVATDYVNIADSSAGQRSKALGVVGYLLIDHLFGNCTR